MGHVDGSGINGVNDHPRWQPQEVLSDWQQSAAVWEYGDVTGTHSEFHSETLKYLRRSGGHPNGGHACRSTLEIWRSRYGLITFSRDRHSSRSSVNNFTAGWHKKKETEKQMNGRSSMAGTLQMYIYIKRAGVGDGPNLFFISWNEWKLRQIFIQWQVKSGREFRLKLV